MSSTLLRRTFIHNFKLRPGRVHATSRRQVSTNTTSTSASTNNAAGAKPARSFATVAAVAAVASAAAYAAGSIYPPSTVSLLFPRPAPAPLDPSTPEAKAYTEDLEASLQNLPLLKQLRERDDADQWYEVRPYENYPEERRVNNLTAGALRGPGKLALRPLIRCRKDESEAILFIHLGRGLCGHDGIVHGGLLATLLDEGLGRMAISNLPVKVGVTATLNLTYRAPTRADQWIVIHISLKKVQGRKAVVVGRLEDTSGTVLVEAEALFVQPRYAESMNTSVLRLAMGEPPKSDAPVLLADGEKLKSNVKDTL